ncbi:hypothetical protein ROTAS13_03502 [Roseomonas sp. TAS13]|uniref:hypothetical protein n=1 Tax=Roseomonas TaxID=125216 RepID=UPI0009633CAE|nr:hypothetical protein [Roseomonas sp. TAS13]GAV35823.1 hypothetical protein ROTAS13_03502 [Roseomonas sp. TAS13]
MPAADGTGVPAGAVYNGDGRLLLGSGPAFSLGLVTDRAFQAVLHKLDEPGNTIEPEDCLWLLPEGLVPGAPLPEHVLASLAAVVRAGRKVVVMADGTEAGNWACEAIEQALDARQGSA